VTTQGLLGKDEPLIHGDLEDAATGLDQLDLGIGMPAANLRRQTDGAGPVVSHHAKANTHFHRVDLSGASSEHSTMARSGLTGSCLTLTVPRLNLGFSPDTRALAARTTKATTRRPD
jgi:hypothetical protein